MSEKILENQEKNLRKSNLNLLRLKTYKNSEKSQRSSPTFRGHGKSTVAVPPSTTLLSSSFTHLLFTMFHLNGLKLSYDFLLVQFSLK